MKKRFFLSFSLILGMMSFIAVPLQTAHADGNISGNAHLLFGTCNAQQCQQLTLRFTLSDVNPNTKTQMIISVKKDSCDLGQGHPQFIDQGESRNYSGS